MQSSLECEIIGLSNLSAKFFVFEDKVRVQRLVVEIDVIFEIASSRVTSR